MSVALSLLFLASMLAILSLSLVITFLHFTKLILKVPYFFVISQFFTLLYGPLLLFYVSSLLRKDYKLSFKHLLHFIPLHIQVKLAWPLVLKISETSTGYLMNIFEDLYFPIWNVGSLGRIIHLSAYLIICQKIYLLYSKAQKASTARTQIRP